MPVKAKHISEISIENFRGFQKLELTGLQAVNLIVGHNNAGKTSLLEALALAANPTLIADFAGKLRDSVGDVEHRFYRWLIRDGSTASSATLHAKGEKLDNLLSLTKRESLRHLNEESFYNMERESVYSSPYFIAVSESPVRRLRVQMVSTARDSNDILVKRLGNALRKREGEKIIHDVLKKIDPRISRVRVDPVDEGTIVSVDIGLSEMIPLPQAGQAVGRLVSIMSDLIGESPQICMIDEIENGIHHTVLKDVWKGIAEISSMLGVQVFATTHSKECLEAAQEVFCSDDSANERDFAVIQLMRVNDQVVGKVLSESRVEAALENHIELR